MKPQTSFWLGVVVALLTFQLQQPAPAPGPVPDEPAPVVVVEPGTAATYVFDKNSTAPPAAVMKGLDRLNRERKILATLYELPDEGQSVPPNYKVPLNAAKTAGLPALVVTVGEKVVNVVKAPTTEEQVWGAVK